MANKKAERSATMSTATRQLMRERAVERGRQRSIQVGERVRATMTMIEEEIASNLGAYPHNKGAISAAEIARRACIHPTTLHSPHQQKLWADIKLWLTKIKLRDEGNENPSRRNVSERIASWKQLYDGLAQSHRDTELDLQEAQAKLQQLRHDFDALEREYIRLQEMLKTTGNLNVLQFLRPPRDGNDSAESSP